MDPKIGLEQMMKESKDDFIKYLAEFYELDIFTVNRLIEKQMKKNKDKK